MVDRQEGHKGLHVRQPARRMFHSLARKRRLALPRLPIRLRRIALFTYLAALGPGLIAANAGNDAGGIATYASLGSGFGYQLLWVVLVSAFALAVVQEMAARLGAVTGKGFSELIREQFGVRWTLLIILALLVANTGIAISEFIGLGAAAELIGIPRFIAVPLAGAALWVIIVLGSYNSAERLLLVMTLAFLAYPVSAVLAHPDWGQVLHGSLVPSMPLTDDAIIIIIATVGTTISPYLPLYLQSSVIEKGAGPEDLKMQRIEVFGGQFLAAIVAMAIVIATAATLFQQGIRVEDAADAAQALEPVAGAIAELLFAAGLFGACMLAGAVLPVATAYSVTEAIGFEKGISRSFKEAPVFIGLFTGILATGVLVALIPGLPVISVIVLLQVVNGLVLPIVLIALLRLANNAELMGKYKNGTGFNIIAWGTVIGALLLSITLVGLTIGEWFGIF